MTQTIRKIREWAFRDNPRAEVRVRRLWLPLIVLVTGLCASLQTWRLLERYERRLVQTRLATRAEEGVTAIDRSFSSTLNDLQTIGAVFECSKEVTPDEFKVFTAPILNQSDGPLALLWVPFVHDRQPRSSSLPARRVANDAEPEATILPGQPTGRVSSTSEPFAIAYIEPYHRRGSHKTRDLVAAPVFRDTLNRARTTNQIALSQRSPVDGGTWGVVAVLPVRGTDPAPEHTQVIGENLRGFVVAVYRVEDIVEMATRGLAHAGIEVALFDRSAPKDKQILYWRGLRATEAGAIAVPSGSELAASPMLTKRFAMGDRQWEIVSRLTPWYIAGQKGWSPLIAAAAAFVSTLLIVCYIVSLTRHHEERKEAEETLRSNEEFLHSLLERSPVPLVVETRAHEVVLLSGSFSALFGYTTEEIRTLRDWWNVAFPDEQYRDRVVKSWFERVQRGVLDRAKPEPMVADATCKGGSVRRIEFSFSSYDDRMLVVFNDLTDQLQRQETLRLAKEEAEQASRAKSQFLATMSHELRTPLNGVIGMTELLKGTELDTQQECFLRSCHNSAESLLSLINDVLDFSKIEAGKLDLQEYDFDLDRLVEETADLMARRAHAKAIELLCSIDPKASLRVRGDSVRIRQVLANLVSNAIKFTEAGEVTIHVHVPQIEGEFVAVRLSVTDTGIGIPEDRIDHLFDPFSPVDDSATGEHGGSGVGLAISKRLVEMMDGQIDVESEEGCGSTFWFEIPLRKLDGQTSPTAFGDERLLGRRALIVDDNQSARQILGEQLSTCGVTCEAATGVDEALVSIRHAEALADPFDLVLADFSMPGRDGCDLAALFADREDLPVIVLSAFDTMLDASEQRRLGIARCLTKPVKRSELLEAITSALADDSSVGHELPDDQASDITTGSENVVSKPTPIDTEALYGRCMGNVEFAESLLKDFAHVGGERVEQILRSLEECDATGMADTAHSLKGAAAIVAAEDLRSVAARLESTGRSGDLDDAVQFADQLRVEMKSCVDFILQPERLGDGYV